MRKKIIIAVLSIGLATYFGLKSELVSPLLEAVYCKVAPSEC